MIIDVIVLKKEELRAFLDKISSKLKKLKTKTIAKADSGGGAVGRAHSLFLQSLVFFCNHFEELQTV